VIKTCYNDGQKERLCLIIDKCRRQKLCKLLGHSHYPANNRVARMAEWLRLVRNTIFRKAPPSVVSGYGKRSYRHPNSEAGNDEIQNVHIEDFYFVGITF
jgi:hypothetical protein